MSLKNPESIKHMFNYCIVICYIDEFYIQFDLVRIRDPWNVIYVNMSSFLATSTNALRNGKIACIGYPARRMWCIVSYPASRSWKRRSVAKVLFETNRKASGDIFCESTFEVHIKFDLFDLIKDFVFVTRNSFNTWTK